MSPRGVLMWTFDMGYYWGKEGEGQPYTAADGDKGGDKAAIDGRDRDAWQPRMAATRTKGTKEQPYMAADKDERDEGAAIHGC